MKKLLQLIKWYNAAEAIENKEWEKAEEKAFAESTERYGTKTSDYTSKAWAEARAKQKKHYAAILEIVKTLSEDEWYKILKDADICADEWIYDDFF